jgi:poly-gamma-glutamate synthesis protein (capsule biosynthesis protein)
MYNGTLAIVGELEIARPFSMRTEPEFLALLKILRDADTTCGHLEMLIHSYEGYPLRPFPGSETLHADPIMANEIKKGGIDIVSCAANHCLEWGADGILSTIKNLDSAGVIHAGTGMSLEEAREPAYFESEAGRVALISISSGHHPYDSAGLAKPPIKGRPGVNPLRVTLKFVLDRDSAEKQKEIWQKLGLSTRPRPYLKLSEGEFYLNLEHCPYESYLEGFMFGVGDECSVVDVPNQWDIECILKSVRDARKVADLVLVGHHNALADPKRGYTPSKFIPPFAKACIDAGADVYIGHGWHRELGLEIYKNKPIFYGRGTFWAQLTSYLNRLPADSYEAAGLDLNNLTALTPEDYRGPREPQGGLGHAGAPTGQYIGGTIPLLTLEEGRLSEIKLYPYSLGRIEKRMTGTRLDGRPMLTSGENARMIIDYMKQLSVPFGTSVEFKEGIGVVKLS